MSDKFVMLATDAKKCKRLEEIVKEGVLISPKLDGYRCLAILDEGNCYLYSRNSHLFKNFPTIEVELSRCFPSDRYVFDGEIMGENGTFKEVQENAFAEKRLSNTCKLNYNIFDMIDFNEWNDKDFIEGALDRYAKLSSVMSKIKSSIIKIVPHVTDNKLSNILAMEKTFVRQGYEGAIICPVNEPYYQGRRSNKLMKLKTMISQDCVVTDFTEGMGKYKGILGNIIVTQENGMICEIGTGFTDDERKEIWNNKDNYKGRIVEIKYQELSGIGIMRFPVFVRWRDTKETKGLKI